MVEHALQAALAAGLTAAEFWPQTPYLTSLATEARAKRQFELALSAGWYAERFAREKSLKPLQEYTSPTAEDGPDEAQEAAAREWAAAHGLRFKRVEKKVSAPVA